MLFIAVSAFLLIYNILQTPGVQEGYLIRNVTL